jgi:hypothetical protein
VLINNLFEMEICPGLQDFVISRCVCVFVYSFVCMCTPAGP